MLSLKKKGLVASVAALAMAVGGLGIGAGVANAADPDPAAVSVSGDQTLTLSGATSGDTYKVWKIGAYVNACTTKTTSIAAVKTNGAASDAIGAAATRAGVTLTGDDKVAAASGLPSLGYDIREIASHLSASDMTGVPEATDAEALVAGGDVSGLAPGWYAITDQYKQNGVDMNGVTTLLGTPCGDVTKTNTGTAALKPHDGGNGNTNPTKTVEGAIMKGANDVFTLSANLPDYSKFDQDTFKYVFIDHPSSALTVDFDSLKVEADGQPVAVADYTLNKNAGSNPAGGTDFSIDVSPYLKKTAGVKKVSVYYTAKVADTLKDTDIPQINSFDVDNNGVKVPEGPNDPNPNNPGNDTPIAPKASLKFTKQDNAKHPLAGAVFTLTMVDDPATPVDESQISVTATSNADGVVEFDNLGAAVGADADANDLPLTAKYTITETTAPTKDTKQKDDVATADYMKMPGEELTGTVTITKLGKAAVAAKAAVPDDPSTPDVNEAEPAVVAQDAVEGEATASLTESKDVNNLIDGQDDKLVFTNVKNLSELPLTGAAGVVLFVVIAVLLAGGATVMVTVSKRNKKNALAL